MHKTLLIAWREFCATVFTKGFLIGILMTPVLILIAIGGFVLLMREGGPSMEAKVAVIDRTPGQKVLAHVTARFSPEWLEKESKQDAKKAGEVTKQATDQAPMSPRQKDLAGTMAAQAVSSAARKAAKLIIDPLSPDADPVKEKEVVAAADVHIRASNPNAPLPRAMLVVIPETAVKSARNDDDGKPIYDTFEIYSSPKIDFEISERVQRRVAQSIVDARIEADPRIAGTGLSAEDVRALVARPDPKVISVTPTGEKKATGAAKQFIPMAFLLLMFMAIMVSSQSLLTSTIEEKSSRVMEVLLSAVSPMQLMTGKILGQMGVGLLMIGIYSGAGIVGMVYASMQDDIEPIKILYLAIYFLIGYFTIASMMAAVGSAVSELREAQTLMTPVMMLMVIPWVLWMPISRAPNSMFAQVLSFVPGCNAFVMVTRLFGSEPVPFWQIPASIIVGALGALFCAWAAAKIFRIGVLMYGKPPDWKTLIKWIRMA